VGIRRRARENALKILFACELGRNPIEDVIPAFWGDFETNTEGREFAEELARGTIAHLAEIDEAIQAVSIHWKINRMACVDRNILRMAAFELFYLDEIPKRVTLNEAIEIAKRYGNEDSWAFINGILDKLAEKVEGDD
jgi:transcription antitermination protein NusB